MFRRARDEPGRGREQSGRTEGGDHAKKQPGHEAAKKRLGETPSLVLSRLKTIHGWRPISVKIQPTIRAVRGSGKAHTAIRHTHLFFGKRPFLFFGKRPLRISQRPAAERSTGSIPSPIIHRNAQ